MKSMLVIDGSQTVATLLAEVFSTRGWRVGFCTDGESAMDQLSRSKHYDVVLLSYRISGTDGLKLIRFIRTLEHRNTTAVMMVTGTAQIRNEALAAGADLVLLKPLDTNTLVDFANRLASKTGKFIAGSLTVNSESKLSGSTRVRWYRRRSLERKAAGICAACGKVPAAAKKTCCATCLADMRRRTKERTARRKSLGQCVSCGQPRAEGIVHCRRCRPLSDRVAAMRRALRERRQAKEEKKRLLRLVGGQASAAAYGAAAGSDRVAYGTRSRC